MAKRKIYSVSFKSKVALEAIRGDLTIAEFASNYGVNPNMITRWKKQAVDGLEGTFSKHGQASRYVSYEARIKELHAKIGESGFNLKLMRLIDEKWLKTPFLGSRRMAKYLRDEGYNVSRKRVRRLMRKMGIQAIYPKPRTSRPQKDNPVYPIF